MQCFSLFRAFLNVNTNLECTKPLHTSLMNLTNLALKPKDCSRQDAKQLLYSNFY